MKQMYRIFVISSLLFLFTACQTDTPSETGNGTSIPAENEPNQNDVAEELNDLDLDPVDIEWTEYGEEMGFDMEAPPREVMTDVNLKGSIEKVDDFLDDFIWVLVRKTESIEEIQNREIEYYIPLTGNDFDFNVKLPNGEGDYRITVRIPSIDREDYYYDTAVFNITNVDEAIAREVEYTKYGVENQLQMSDSVQGYNDSSRSFVIEGTILGDYTEHAVLAEVKKDGDKSIVAIPVQDGAFNGEVPLFYGEGTHEILVNLYSGDHDGTYYHSAKLYVNNDSAEIIPEIVQYDPYINRGLTIDNPDLIMDTSFDSIEFPVKGSINPEAPLADTVSHVIVEIQHKDDSKDKATHYFPVVDNKFEGTAYFRFGSGEYRVRIYVPEEEQKISNEFHFTTAIEVNYEVHGIEDERDLLPSRGIESNNTTLIEQGKELTEGLETEREKAKAIYEFVSKHVAYDVEKFKEDLFHPDDSAIATLESGTGICQDYAFLTIGLLRGIDIESRYVEGYAGGRHAWVEAKVDGEWIELDPTWGAGYVDGDDFHFSYNEDYFDPDPDFLDETHTRYNLLY